MISLCLFVMVHASYLVSRTIMCTFKLTVTEVKDVVDESLSRQMCMQNFGWRYVGKLACPENVAETGR